MQIKPTNIVKGVTPRWKYLSDLWSNVNLYFCLTSNQKTIWKENHKQFIRLQLCRTVFPLATTLHSFCNQITFCYIQTECDSAKRKIGKSGPFIISWTFLHASTGSGLKLSPKSHNPNYRYWRIQGTFQFRRKDKLCLVAQIPYHLVNDF